MLQLEAERQQEGEDALEKRLAIAQQLNVGRFVSEINGDSPVFTGGRVVVRMVTLRSHGRCHG